MSQLFGRKIVELSQNVNSESMNLAETRKSAVTVLQFLVGSLVTMGGTLFAMLAINSFGRSLGLIHLSIGLTGLAGGFVALRATPWKRSFLLGINGLTIAYSTVSESVVQIQSLLPSYFSLGSLIGTIIAIIMSGAILCLLLTNNDTFRVTHEIYRSLANSD